MLSGEDAPIYSGDGGSSGPTAANVKQSQPPPSTKHNSTLSLPTNEPINNSRSAILNSMMSNSYVRGQLSAATHQQLYGNVLRGKHSNPDHLPDVVVVRSSNFATSSDSRSKKDYTSSTSRNSSFMQTPMTASRKIRLRPSTTSFQGVETEPDYLPTSASIAQEQRQQTSYLPTEESNESHYNPNSSPGLPPSSANHINLKNVSFLASQISNEMYSSRWPQIDQSLLKGDSTQQTIQHSSRKESLAFVAAANIAQRESRSAGRIILPKNSALATPKDFARRTMNLSSIEGSSMHYGSGNNNNSILLMPLKGEGSSSSSSNNNKLSHFANSPLPAVQIIHLNDKEDKNMMSLYTPKTKEEDFKVIADSQNFAKMDREALLIRLAILETENKETKCHNIHLSDKFKELLEEYKRYKEYMDGVDRKSLYQKHVQRLSDLSKQLFEQRSAIDQREKWLREMEESKRLVEEEVVRLKNELTSYDVMKEQQLRAIEESYKQITIEQAQRIEALLKEQERQKFFEKSFNEATEKIKEETKRFSSVIDRSDERYGILMQRWRETEKECQFNKDRVKLLEVELKRVQDSNNAKLAEKSQAYESIIEKQEKHQREQVMERDESIQKLREEVQMLIAKNEELALQMHRIKESIAVHEDEKKEFHEATTQLAIQSDEQNTQVEDLNKQINEMEKAVIEKDKLVSELQEQLKQVESLHLQIDGLQKKNEEMALLREQMQEAHLAEMNKVLKQQNEITSQLNQKMQEMKQQYEVELDKLQSECFERVKLSSTTATDAQRQTTILKVTFTQEMERKETEIDFLKNKIYQEKQRLKDQIENQYRDVILDLERRTEYLTKEMDKQKWVLESSICEDLAVYNSKSKYWRKSREIRAQKLLNRTEESEVDGEEDVSPVGKLMNGGRRSNAGGRVVVNPAERQRIRLQVIAKCAKAFDTQQQKIDSMRMQIEFLTDKTQQILRKSNKRLSTHALQSQQSGEITLDGSDSTGKLNSSYQQQSQEKSQQQQNMNAVRSELANFIAGHRILPLIDDEDDDDDESPQVMLQAVNAKLVEKLKISEEELAREREINAEIQEKFMQREYEMQENHKQKMKQVEAQIDLMTQGKTQLVFQKDIIIEKLTHKVESIKRQCEENSVLNTNHLSFTYKLRREFKDLEDRHALVMSDFKKDQDQLVKAIFGSDGYANRDTKEIQRLVELVREKTDEIRDLKYQSNQMRGDHLHTSSDSSSSPTYQSLQYNFSNDQVKED